MSREQMCFQVSPKGFGVNSWISHIIW